MIGTALLAAGPAGWAIGLIYMGVDLISLWTSGKSLTENILTKLRTYLCTVSFFIFFIGCCGIKKKMIEYLSQKYLRLSL